MGMSLLHMVEKGITRLVRRFAGTHRATPAGSAEPRGPVRVHADERAIRRTAEVQDGGVSSEESRAAYERGDNPGGLHRGGKNPDMPHRGGREDE
jgi:hypothetical protein